MKEVGKIYIIGYVKT